MCVFKSASSDEQRVVGYPNNYIAKFKNFEKKLNDFK